METQKRCPNGTRRNKKTGKCDPVEKSLSNKTKKNSKESNDLEIMQSTIHRMPSPPIALKESPKPISKKESPEKKSPEIESKIEEFKNKGYSVLSDFDKKTIEEIIQLSKDAYYNGSTPLLTDNEYDIIEDYYKSKWSVQNLAVGAPISGKNKVILPYKMASMDKIKPDSGALSNWTKKYKGNYVLSCKLDGVSGLYVCDSNGKHHLYTRGDGNVGQDISHLIKPLGLPNLPRETAIRGEFIISKDVFERKYKNVFANARNLVSGMINRKGVDEKIGDLHYVSYEVITPKMIPSEQLLFSKQLGCEVVQYQTVDTLSNEYLSAILIDWRSKYDYEIDGVIVTDNHIYERIDGNPEHAFAFKMVLSDQVAEAKVVDIIWTPSKDGYLKPRVRIEPIQLAGVRIEYATGFNAKFIQDNNIGLGAIITMVRSGDVIPYIKSVSVPADQPLMPKIEYKWTSTLVDIMLKDGSTDNTVLEKNITNFFVSLEVEGLSSGNVKRMMDAGFVSVHSILLAKKEDFMRVEGFKEKMVNKIYDSIQEKVGKASLVDIIVASGKLGRGLGKRKISPIFDKYPDILLTKESNEIKMKQMIEIEGIGSENAKTFVSNIPQILDFLHVCELEHKLFMHNVPSADTKLGNIENISDKADLLFSGKKIVMTKTRDKDIISFIERMGGTFEDNIKKDTYLLIVKTKDDSSNKTEYAKKNGIPILSVDEFKEKYLQ